MTSSPTTKANGTEHAGQHQGGDHRPLPRGRFVAEERWAVRSKEVAGDWRPATLRSSR